VGELHLRGLSGLPEISPGEDLAGLIVSASAGCSAALGDGTIVAIAQKAVSKAEGAIVDLREVKPSKRACDLAAEQGKDARAVQVVLDQSAEILRADRGVLVCQTHHGFVCANAGVDSSNAADPETLIVLPRDPDASARRIRARLQALTGMRLAVLITDSFGRAWRHGQLDTAIGCAGLTPLEDWRGRADAFGRQLHATWLASADALAAASELVRAKDSGEPVVLIGGLERLLSADDGPGARALLRPPGEDFFR
jgi:coenzyme F420-0:L-glutamate ligase/coenzyme F420-1:gamma-L-glutamate ligase